MNNCSRPIVLKGGPYDEYTSVESKNHWCSPKISDYPENALVPVYVETSETENWGGVTVTVFRFAYWKRVAIEERKTFNLPKHPKESDQIKNKGLNQKSETF